jgi:hypothetical protein
MSIEKEARRTMRNLMRDEKGDRVRREKREIFEKEEEKEELN